MGQIEYRGDYDELPDTQKLAWNRFKRSIEQEIFAEIFGSCQKASHDGKAVRCSDGLVRLVHPGLLIESLDAKQAAECNCTRQAGARHPCPKCLIHHNELHHISGVFDMRTSDLMQSVLEKAEHAGTKTKMEQILVDYGLHKVKVRQHAIKNA